MVSQVRDDIFYFSLITFAVEGVLFRVPRQYFERGSEVFKDMFSLPSTGATEEGTSDEKPLLLPEVSAKSFRALLRVLSVDTSILQVDAMFLEDWLSILKLSHIWRFSQLFTLATELLDADECDMDPVERIILAESYEISDWFRQAYFELAMRTEPPTRKEVDKLGLDNILKLAKVRERRYRWIIENDHAFVGNYERRSRLLDPELAGDSQDKVIKRYEAAVHAVITEVFGFKE